MGETHRDQAGVTEVVMASDDWPNDTEAAEDEALRPWLPAGTPPITATPDGVMTIRLADGRRLSFGPAATETGELASGWDWTRYSAGDEPEAQDWAETEEEMFAVLKAFAGAPDMSHNHVTRDIKPAGSCPACDRYHDNQAAS